MIIEFKNVSKIYYKERTQLREALLRTPQEEFHVINNISFSITKGERVAFIGLNGAGKSTILKMISRITVPTYGQITINGSVASLLEVGAGFHGELTGYQNTFMNGTILGISKKEIKKALPDIIDFSGISYEFMDMPLNAYSSGMKSRLGFSIARKIKTDILILDETLSVGDASFKKKVDSAIRDMFKDDRTILFVTHSINSVLELATKVIWLEKGSIMEIGNPQEIIEKYLKYHHIK